MKRVILDYATEEADEAEAYYNQQRDGLGKEFILELRDAFQRISDNPTAWPVIYRNARRCLLSRFPYTVIFYIQNETIVIIAIMHQRRRPFYWRHRL